jgi:hypothetical protein
MPDDEGQVLCRYCGVALDDPRSALVVINQEGEKFAVCIDEESCNARRPPVPEAVRAAFAEPPPPPWPVERLLPFSQHPATAAVAAFLNEEGLPPPDVAVVEYDGSVAAAWAGREALVTLRCHPEIGLVVTAAGSPALTANWRPLSYPPSALREPLARMMRDALGLERL